MAFEWGIVSLLGCCDRMWGNGFKQKGSGFRLDIRRKFLVVEGGETPEQVAQRSLGCLIPGSVQEQVGWGSDPPVLVGGVLPMAGRLELNDL